MRGPYPLPDKEMQPDYPVSVRVDSETLWVTLYDGRIIGTPLAWYPELSALTLAELRNCELTTSILIWPDRDISLSVEGMLAGINPAQRDRQSSTVRASTGS
jgi:hypothetical protein